MPSDYEGRDTVAAALDVVAGELEPLVASFFSVGDDGAIDSAVVHGSHLPPAELAQEVRTWKVRLRGVDPLAPTALGGLSEPIATLRHVGGKRRAVLDRRWVRRAYEDIGAINDARLLIRGGGRVIAGVTLWRPLRARGWTSGQLRLLAALQPLIEMAYLSTIHAASSIDARLPAALTGRQRQVAHLLAAGATNPEIARALYVSPDTAKSHTRTVLSKAGMTSRREMVMRFSQAVGDSSAGAAPDRPANGDLPGAPAVLLEGDEAPQRLLTAVLAWSAERIGGVLGGCALISARHELVAQAWGSTGSAAQEADPRLARRVHRQLLPSAQPAEVERYLDTDSARVPVVQLDASRAPGGDEQFGELVATLGLTAPLVAVLRLQGRVAGLIWLCGAAGASPDQRERVRALRSVHPLLELTHVTRLADTRSRATTPEQLAHFGLTPREMAVARLALGGSGNAAIARRLRISESTVKKHMTRILGKCGVRSRTQLIALVGDDAHGD